MKWYKYEYGNRTTYPKKEGYYWVVFYWASIKKGVVLAYWRDLEWFVGNYMIGDDVKMWANKSFTLPKLPKKAFYKGVVE